MSFPVAITPYRDEDLVAVAQIWWQGWSPSPGEPDERPPSLLADMIERIPRELATRWSLFVATTDGTVVGMLAFTREEKYLDELFVAETRRGHGIGKALLDFTKTQLPEGFWLRTNIENDGARRFYAREGLVHVEDRPHPRFPERVTSVYEWKPRG
jgi:GNAT superfamily N-acetyltransferase